MDNSDYKNLRIMKQLRAADDAFYGALLTRKNFNQKKLDDDVRYITSNFPWGIRNLQVLSTKDEKDLEKNSYLTLSQNVLISLSIEIYLKLLLVICEVKQPKTHNLKTLFNLIYNKNPNLIKKIFGETETIMINNLILEKNKNTFESWRYFYEHEEIYTHTGFLFDIASYLHCYFSDEYINLKSDFSL